MADQPSREISTSPRYGDNERAFALKVLAIFDGDSRAAAKALKEEGLDGPSDRTLREWASRTHVNEYLSAKKETAPGVLAAHSEGWTRIAKKARAATEKGLGPTGKEHEQDRDTRSS